MDAPTYQAMFEFRFIQLPTLGALTFCPEAPAEMDEALEILTDICEDLTKASRAGQLGPILTIPGGLLIGELAGFVAVGPDIGGIMPVPGILKPS